MIVVGVNKDPRSLDEVDWILVTALEGLRFSDLLEQVVAKAWELFGHFNELLILQVVKGCVLGKACIDRVLPLGKHVVCVQNTASR